MAQEKPKRVAEWSEAVREHLPVVGGKIKAGAREVRENPSVVLHHPATRYVLWGIGAIVLLWGASWLANMIAPPIPQEAVDRSLDLDFRVICSNASCGHEFVIKREKGFRKFPVNCVKCNQRTGERAVLCTSTTCKSRWVVPIKRESGKFCPNCNTPLS